MEQACDPMRGERVYLSIAPFSYSTQKVATMRTIHVTRSGSKYTICHFHFEDVVGLVIYLRARGVAQEVILNTVEILARDGEHTFQHE
jgi:hypothetical protein